MIAFVARKSEANAVVRWGAHFASADNTTLTVLCHSYAPTVLPAQDISDLEEEVQTALLDHAQNIVNMIEDLPSDQVQVLRAVNPNAAGACLDQVRLDKAQLVVAASSDPEGRTGANYSTSPLLRQMPCSVMLLFSPDDRSSEVKSIHTINTSGPHDRTTVALAVNLGNSCGANVSITTIEEEGFKPFRPHESSE